MDPKEFSYVYLDPHENINGKCLDKFKTSVLVKLKEPGWVSLGAA